MTAWRTSSYSGCSDCLEANGPFRSSSHSQYQNCLEAAWRRSAHCEYETCLEAAWRKATRSVGNGACVEAAHRGVVLVRDSKLGDRSPHLVFSPAAWKEFLCQVRAGTAVT